MFATIELQKQATADRYYHQLHPKPWAKSPEEAAWALMQRIMGLVGEHKVPPLRGNLSGNLGEFGSKVPKQGEKLLLSSSGYRSEGVNRARPAADDSDLSQCDQAEDALEAFPLGGGKARARPQVTIDGLDLLPAQRTHPFRHRVLQELAFLILSYLFVGGLAKVDDRLASQMLRFDFGIVQDLCHRLFSSLFERPLLERGP